MSTEKVIAQRRWLILGASFVFACAGSPTTPSPDKSPAARRSVVLNSPLRPDEILDILERSAIMYDLDSDADVQATDLTSVVEEANLPRRPVDPFFEVVRDEAGRRRLRSSPPPEHVAALFREADLAFSAKAFEAALDLYQRAVAQAPGYFKGHTFLGNAYLFLGRNVEAEQSFLRALKLNPLDYQAYMFLGQAYVNLGQPAMAKRAWVRAYMLNRANPSIKEGLTMALAQLSQRIREENLSPRIRIVRDDKGRVRVKLDKDRGVRWLALATCLACWAYEDDCSRRGPESEDPLRLSMYRECLINQAASTAIRDDQHDDIGPDERLLLTAIEDGFLDAIVVWEVVARRLPAVVLLLPDQIRTSILEYIDRYVIVSSQLATADGRPPAEGPAAGGLSR